MKPNRILALCAVIALAATGMVADNLVILSTNDVHGNIRPERIDKPGGLVRAKVLVDSIRKAEQHVLLLDAGDDVQGFMYFSLFGGRVEYEMMNRMGYELTTLGNHEFDNGLDSLARNYDLLDIPVINANYNFDNTPLKRRVKPYTIKHYRGRRIAIIGVGANPESLVSEPNYAGMTYREPAALADSIAGALKASGKADYAILLSHCGYRPGAKGLPSDSVTALTTRNIDIIIGGHSHTSIDPVAGNHQYLFTNLAGRTVLVTQNKNEGVTMGKITINLDNLNEVPGYELLPVDNRYDGRLDEATERWLKPYDEKVDSIMKVVIGHSESEMQTRTDEIGNWVSDAMMQIGQRLFGGEIDCAVTNKGGIRKPIYAGDVTLGQVMSMVPFTNTIQLLEMDGETLQKCLDAVAQTGGQCISDEIRFTAKGGKAQNVRIGGKALNKKQTYRIVTIDYIAAGNDHLEPFSEARVVATSDRFLKYDIVDYIKSMTAKGQTIKADPTARMKKK